MNPYFENTTFFEVITYFINKEFSNPEDLIVSYEQSVSLDVKERFCHLALKYILQFKEGY